MLLDLEQSTTSDQLTCDIAIVGAGAVGLTMAAELSKSGTDVLLLEAGGTGLENASQQLYTAAKSVGHPLPGLHSGRYRMLGGTTNFWGGQLVRFDPIVFGNRPWLPPADWPINRETLDPHYDRVLDLLRMQCSRDDAETWQKLGIDLPDFGEDLDLFLTRWIPNPNLARAFMKSIEGDRQRTLIHANVIAIDPPSDSSAPVGLRLRTIGGRAATVKARCVVLACGTIEIVRLLQLPTGDGAEAPWVNSPWLGRGFVDHVDCVAGDIQPIDAKAFHHLFDNIYLDGYKYNPKIKLSEAAQRRDELLGIGAHFLFLSDYGEHLDNLKLFVRALMGGRVPKDLRKLPQHIAALWRVALPLAARYIRANRAFNPADRGIKLRLTSEQFPNAKSSIRLGSNLDPLGLPVAEVDWQLDGREMETFATFAERLRDELRNRNLADVLIDPLLAARDSAFLASTDDGYHQMGGARIGRTAEQGVVDANLKVHAGHGVYVAGAAVFPSTGFANPTFTAMALGLRLADHLRGKR